jgi:hypothetical protein
MNKDLNAQIAVLSSLIAASQERQRAALDRLRTMKERLNPINTKQLSKPS